MHTIIIIIICYLVSWCFKPSQPQRITSGLNNNNNNNNSIKKQASKKEINITNINKKIKARILIITKTTSKKKKLTKQKTCDR